MPTTLTPRQVPCTWLRIVAFIVGTVLTITCPSQSLAQGAKFINLTVPDPGWTDREATWVLKATDKDSIVAQGGASRWGDIRVVEVKGNDWQFVGGNGRGITGVKGSIVNAAAVSPDGRLWLVAEHARFPNQIPGNQFCLYAFEDDNWIPIGPRFGAQAPREDLYTGHDNGLYFFRDNRPVTVSIQANLAGEDSTWRTRLRRLEGDRWVGIPSHDYLSDRTTSVTFVWREHEACLVEVHATTERTKASVRRIKGPLPEDVEGPFQLDSWPQWIPLFHFALSPAGSIAVNGRAGTEVDGDVREFIKIYHPVRERDYEAEEAPPRPEAGGVIQALGWGQDGALFVVAISRERLVVDRYADGGWTRVAGVEQPREFETILMDARLFFRDDGLPIVTWETFTPVDIDLQ